ncbi:flavoprotein-like protein [Gorgonomyces haynaldii]|nr:flavoprotein-like protein [Gorgonomyces haynaldii]
MPKVFVIVYSAWGHVLDLAKEEVKGLKEAGVDAELYQVPETLPTEVTQLMHIQKFDVPVLNVADLAKADGFLFGIPTRYGGAPAQLKSFWDATGQLWAAGALHGKFAGIFVSTSTQHGGIETTAYTFLPNLVHHGINFVPFGYKNKNVGNATEIHGASPWGAGTVNTQGEGKKTISDLERGMAFDQGKEFGLLIKKVAQ